MCHNINVVWYVKDYTQPAEHLRALTLTILRNKNKYRPSLSHFFQNTIMSLFKDSRVYVINLIDRCVCCSKISTKHITNVNCSNTLICLCISFTPVNILLWKKMNNTLILWNPSSFWSFLKCFSYVTGDLWGNATTGRQQEREVKWSSFQAKSGDLIAMVSVWLLIIVIMCLWDRIYFMSISFGWIGEVNVKDPDSS